MTSTLSLADVTGDYLTFAEYCAWRGEAERTVRRQIRCGTAFVMPVEERPRLKWRKADCERKMLGADLVRDRQRRARLAMAS